MWQNKGRGHHLHTSYSEKDWKSGIMHHLLLGECNGLSRESEIVPAADKYRFITEETKDQSLVVLLN
jgi:hypothetical protein